MANVANKINNLLFGQPAKEEIQNVTVDTPKKGDVIQSIIDTRTDNVRKSLAGLRTAYNDARDPEIKDRLELIEIYQSIESDTHVTALVSTLVNAICEMEFAITTNGEIDEDKTALFESSWFRSFISSTMDAVFWGFSGVQLGDVVDDKFVNITRIPKQNIKPETREIKTTSYDNNNNLISFDTSPIDLWTILIYPDFTADDYRLGLYYKASALVILKKEMQKYWATYNQLFGMPFRVLKIEGIDNPVNKQNAVNSMITMEGAGWTIISADSELEFASTGGENSGYANYQEFINDANSEMSKMVLGSTMVTDDGSSRSQAEVHDDNTARFIKSKAKWLETVINDELIPRMARLGFPISTDDKFKFITTEKVSKLEWVQIIASLSPNFDIDPEFIEKMTGVPVTQKGETVTTQSAQNVSNLLNTYRNIK